MTTMRIDQGSSSRSQLWQDCHESWFNPPTEVLGLVKLGLLREASDKNDQCPRFELVVPSPKGCTLRVWVEAEDEDERAHVGSDRFAVSVYDPEGEDEEVFVTDCVHELVQCVQTHASTWEATSRIQALIVSIEQLGLPRQEATMVTGDLINRAARCLTDEIDRQRFVFLSTVFVQEVGNDLA